MLIVSVALIAPVFLICIIAFLAVAFVIQSWLDLKKLQNRNYDLKRIVAY